MGLVADIYTSKATSYDCTKGGISSKAKDVCIVNAEGPFEPTDDRPAVILRKGAFPGIVVAVPAVKVGNNVWREMKKNGSTPMAGGNFISTSDSRFGEAVERITENVFYGAVALHDRFE